MQLLLQGMKRPDLKDELYMQLLKQSRGNVTPSAYRAWELFLLVASTMPPSKGFIGLVSEYVHTMSYTEQGLDEKVKVLALRTWHALKRSTRAGSRRTVSFFSSDKALSTTFRVSVWQKLFASTSRL